MKRWTGWLAALSMLVGVPALAQPAAPAPPGRILSVNGIDLHYREVGSGEPLLLLHGFGACGNDWGSMIDSLATRYRVIIPDLRGHGRSTDPAGGRFTMRRSSEDIAALLDHLGLEHVKAMGISAGAMNLIHLATRQPDRIEAMVLIGGTPEFRDHARAVLAGVRWEVLPPFIREMFMSCAARGEPQVRQLIDQFRGFATSRDDMVFTPAMLGTIRARTLIVHGDRDEFFPVDIPVEMYGAIPGSQLWIVPNGDHVPIYDERTPEFLRVTMAFLAGPPPAAPPTP